jgi:hypothetical protein
MVNSSYGSLTDKDHESQPRIEALGVLDGLVAELEPRTPEVESGPRSRRAAPRRC